MTTSMLRSALALLLGLSLAMPGARAEEAVEWRHRATQGAATLTANPLGTASRASFYIGRGFAASAIQPYAEACGFSFGMQNAGGAALTTRLADWHAIGADGRRIALRLPQDWDAEWARAGVPQAARIAFRWAQFQAENTFAPGDWIMGMATLAERPRAPFRLVAPYFDDKGNHAIVLDRLACAD